MDISSYSITALMATGIGIVFLVSDWRSTSSRLYAALLILIAASIELNVLFQIYGSVEDLPNWMHLSGLPVALAIVTANEWLLRVRRTIPAAELNTSFGDLIIRLAQVSAVIYGAMTLIFWQERAEWNMFRIGRPGAWRDTIIQILSLPLLLSILLMCFPVFLTLNRKPDWLEKIRLITFVIAVPFLCSGFILAPQQAIFGLAIGLIILLISAIQYHMVQGQRGMFMSRFLAPQVAKLVSQQGLQRAIRDQSLEISVVYCDIRGFTAFAEKFKSDKVIQFLREYYDAIGVAATEVGGTIKDYAGDGVLILIGAPIPCLDFPQKAVRLAEALLQQAGEVAHRHQSPEHPLGVGIGIATGEVIVGVVGGTRLEYVAVGSAVNLAARLCQIAKSGQILLDHRTSQLLDGTLPLQAELPVDLKGFAEPVIHYSLKKL